MINSTKKFDTYEDFVEHMTMLLSHNEYPSDTNAETISYFVREISKIIDSKLVSMSEKRDNISNDFIIGIIWCCILKTKKTKYYLTFSDPQAWGIVGLTNTQILMLYSCVHSILLTGAKDLDEWKNITNVCKLEIEQIINPDPDKGLKTCLWIVYGTSGLIMLIVAIRFFVH